MGITSGMVALLRADATFMALLPGGVYEEPLDPDDPETSAAWVANPATGVKRFRPAAVLLPAQEVDHPNALNIKRRIDVDMWPDLYFYAPRSEISIFDLADQRAMQVLHKQTIGLFDIEATGYRARPLPTPELNGDIWNTLRRFRAQGVHHV